MISRKNILYVIFAAVIALSCAILTGCNRYSDSLQRILAEDRIVFGVERSNMPLSFERGDEPAGLSVDLANELAGRLNVEAEFVFVSPSDVQTALDDGVIDLFVNLPSPGQKEVASMLTVDTGMDYRQILVVTSDSKVSRLFDLAGGTLCLISGSDASVSLNEAKVFKGDLGQILYYENASQQFDAISSGRADAMLIDEPMYRYIMNGVDTDYVVLDEILSQTNLLISLRRQDSRLADRIESLMSDLRDDGTMERLCSSWIG